MPMLKHPKLTEERIRILLDRIRDEELFAARVPLSAQYAFSAEPVPFAKAKNAKFKDIAIGTEWGTDFDCAWFRFRGTVPKDFAGKEVVALIDVGGEGALVDASGTPIQGLTRVGDLRGDISGKYRVDLFANAKTGQKVDLWVDGAANHLFGRQEATLKQCELAVFRRDRWELAEDIWFLQDLMKDLDKNSRHRKLILVALNDAANTYGAGDENAVAACRKILAKELNRRANDSAIEVSAIGHAHMDVAWLWPLRETVRKTGRTFATALRMMEEYPDYKFGASQPHLYQMVKDAYPKLYERVREAIRDGKWECQGAMWVEADCNIPSGESLVRQVLHGKRFYLQEFGVDVDNLWLPDVFGYSAALPQILKKAGVNYFLTQKLSWSQFNRFPHNTMMWRGLDGTGIFTHFPPNDSYSSDCSPHSYRRFETHNQDAERCEHAMELFGIGDGGGGPSRRHLARLARATGGVEDMPKVKPEFAKDFFRKAEKNSRDLLTWSGELYLELHRGTLTTQARNKRHNRQIEQKLRELEAIASIAGPTAYPAKDLDRIWKILLLNQFHDVIPGSSIDRVYTESLEQYLQADKELDALLAKAEKRYVSRVDTSGTTRPVVVRNSLSWDRDDLAYVPRKLPAGKTVAANGAPVETQIVECGGRTGTLVRASIPSMGHTVVSAGKAAPAPTGRLKVSKRRLENDLLRVTFAADGTIDGIYDKQAGRDVLAAGQRGNCLRLFEDRPNRYDAWDIDVFYREMEPTTPKLVSAEVVEDGPLRAAIRFRFQDANYQVDQTVSLRSFSKRIDFRTTVDWNEDRKMLRAEFPVNVFADSATYEIQYGHVARPTHQNTSWDMGRFEVVAHKWADLSQPDYGVAILNDCKYGHQILDGLISLNLLRAPKHPDESADMCRHEFTYSLLPHEGDVHAGNVIREAYELNTPLTATPTTASPGPWAAEMSHVRVEGAPNVIVEVVKQAEDDNDYVLRLYEAAGCDARATVHLGLDVRKAAEVGILEDKPKALTCKNGKVDLAFGPFEIRTIRLKRS